MGTDIMARTVHQAPLADANTLDGGIVQNLITRRRTIVKYFIADEAIGVGQCVALDFAGVAALITTVGKTAADALLVDEALDHVLLTTNAAAGAPGFVGVALDSVASGDKIPVCVGGYCPFVRSDGSVAAGEAIVPAGTAGAVDTYAAGTHTAVGPIGFALDADADQGSDPDAVGCPAMIRRTYF